MYSPGVRASLALPRRWTSVTMRGVNARRLVSAAMALAALCGSPSCNRVPPDPAQHVVAEVGGKL
jgi:hypothetical protein